MVVVLIVGGALATWFVATRDQREPSRVAWNEYCAQCHGESLEGTPSGPALVGVPLEKGDSTQQLITSIAEGVPGTTMSGWSEHLTAELINGLALYQGEHREQFPTIKASYKKEPTATRIIESRYHTFQLERITALQMPPLRDGLPP